MEIWILGIARPILESRSQSKRENYRKKKTVETHVSNEKVRHFIDDDKYSLREMVSNRISLEKSQRILMQCNATHISIAVSTREGKIHE